MHDFDLQKLRTYDVDNVHKVKYVYTKVIGTYCNHSIIFLVLTLQLV